MKFITVKTFSPTPYHQEQRNVTLAYSDKFNDTVLLGSLEHNTQIIIDQELVNSLQEIVNDINKTKTV